MRLSLKKVGGIAFGTGFVVPFLLEIGGRWLDGMHVHTSGWVGTVYMCLWPTGIALISTSDNRQGYAAFSLTAIANGLLYALAAVLVAYYVKLAKNRGYDFHGD